jgi:hypothetical protein
MKKRKEIRVQWVGGSGQRHEALLEGNYGEAPKFRSIGM